MSDHHLSDHHRDPDELGLAAETDLDLHLLLAVRPVVDGPTDDQRHRARAELDAVLLAATPIGAEPIGAEGPLANPAPAVPIPLHDRRRAPRSSGRSTGRSTPSRRRALVTASAGLAVAASLAVVAGAALLGPDAPAPLAPLAAPPAAADQLRAIADVAAQQPYPDGPFVVHTKSVQEDGLVDDLGPSRTAVDQNTWVLGEGVMVGETLSCTVEPPIPTSGPQDGMVCGMGSAGTMSLSQFTTADAMRTEILRRVDEARPNGGGVTSGETTLTEISVALQEPTVTAVARAELLRMLADEPGIVATPDVANEFGARGTRFAASSPGSGAEVVVDPADGYVLAVHRFTNSAPSEHDDGQWEVSVSFERPVAATTIPAPILAARDQARSSAEWLANHMPPPVSDPSAPTTADVSVPTCSIIGSGGENGSAVLVAAYCYTP